MDITSCGAAAPMNFHLIDAISSPGNPAKANDDAWMAASVLAAVIDGATCLNDPIMPGTSDAAWFSHLAAERLLEHQYGGTAQAALRAAVIDLEAAFALHRSRPPVAMHEVPCASLMLIAPAGSALITALSYGDCSAIVLHDGSALVIGDALAKRAVEANEVAKLAQDAGVDPASTSTRAEFLPSLRESRNRYNQGEGPWILVPHVNCVDHAKVGEFSAPTGTVILLASDGFTALVSDYGMYDAAGLVSAAKSIGLSSLMTELREIESNDPSGKQFARYKKSDDATAILVQILP